MTIVRFGGHRVARESIIRKKATDFITITNSTNHMTKILEARDLVLFRLSIGPPQAAKGPPRGPPRGRVIPLGIHVERGSLKLPVKPRMSRSRC